MSRAPLLLVAAALTALAPAAVRAADIDSLYDDDFLRRAQSIYAEGIRWNMENILWRRMTPDERKALSAVELDFPLHSPEREPFAFMASGTRVTMSVLSLQFFEDLTDAYAWLWANGYTVETALEYVSMLKHRGAADFGGRLPEPLTAIRVPKNALADPRVKAMANRIFDSAVIFILLHELGHIYHKHPGYDAGLPPERVRANEAEADAFALEIMRRIGTLPAGMFFYFETMAYGMKNRGDFDSDAAYDSYLANALHPVNESRIRAIAAALKAAPEDFGQEFDSPAQGRTAVLSIAKQIEDVADFEADRNLQRIIAERARRTTLASLAPRRPGEQLGREPEARPDSAEPFDGVYDGAFTVSNRSVDIRVVLRRTGERVVGHYDYGYGPGQIDGVVSGNRLTFSWQEGQYRGHGELAIEADGAGFAGTWGYDEATTGGGSWTGRRR
ncbi:MAG TPA: hypothetical protein VMV26_05995 [Alphaproteobacteria bacterium]|jgi:hypothetical protein|nr:hypothetical protein [Alphaproteobacteria bacterium]